MVLVAATAPTEVVLSGDDDALVAGIAGVEADFGPIDGMATIIGMAAWGLLVDIDMATWDQDHARNLRYFFLAAREVARSLMARRATGDAAQIRWCGTHTWWRGAQVVSRRTCGGVSHTWARGAHVVAPRTRGGLTHKW